MATPNLNIDHITSSGGQKEVVANTAFDDLDKAIAGMAAVVMAIDGDKALTSDETLEAMVLEVTSSATLTATRNVTTHADLSAGKTKIWFVKNSTTGGQSIIFKKTTGTGVTIPNGKEVCVRCDGTNVVACGADTGVVGTSVAQANGPFLFYGSSLPSWASAGHISESLTATLKFKAADTATVPFVVEKFSSSTQKLFKVIVGGVDQLTIDDTGQLNAQGNTIINVGSPSSGAHAVTLNYANANYAPIGAQYLVNAADSSLTAEVPIGALGSTLVFQGSSGITAAKFNKGTSGSTADTVVFANDSGTKQSAITKDGDLDLNTTKKVINMADPTNAQDGATKNYVDSAFGPVQIAFGAANIAVSVGTAQFLYPWFITSAGNTTERWQPISIPGGGSAKLSRFRVTAFVGPTGGSCTFTVRKRTAGGGIGAGSDTAVTCTLAAGTGNTLATDTSNTVTIADGDELSIKAVLNSGGTASPTGIQTTMILSRT